MFNVDIKQTELQLRIGHNTQHTTHTQTFGGIEPQERLIKLSELQQRIGHRGQRTDRHLEI